MRTQDDGTAPILIYDGVNEVYYRTTIKHILMVALKESRDFLGQMEARITDLEERLQRQQDTFTSEMAEKVETLKQEQKSFIADMVKTNETMIELVRANTK